jgi:hypothetical protein
MKYVILDVGGIETPIIFPEHVPHDKFCNMKPVSAGFVKLYGDDKPMPSACCCENAITVSVYGESVGLKLKSRPIDRLLILREIHRHYN